MSRDPVDDDVGFKKTPKHTRFQKGRSGNPSGRHKERPKERANFTTSMNALLNERIPVREGGKIRYMTRAEAIALRAVHEGLKGNPKILLPLMKLIAEFERLVLDAGRSGPGGVLVVPGLVAMEDWERMSAEHVRELAKRQAKESEKS
jgi:hypothetical protein